jgi:Zn-dependent peptidase ImmA (M78 family)/transcriptional regulator with XRE-family HTH domain
MKVGTDNFFGERLTQAREVMGLTQSALAEQIGVKKQAISGYEKNNPVSNQNKGISPNPDVFFKITTFFELPARFFTTPYIPNLVSKPFNRQQKSLSMKSRSKVDHLAYWVCEIFYTLRNYVRLPQQNIPLTPEDEVSVLDENLIKAKASFLRELWGLGDEGFSFLINFAEKNGIVVSEIDFGNEKIDGFFVKSDNNFFIFLNASIKSQSRKVSTLAHELGHICLHSNVSNSSRDEFDDVIENQAWAFARHFLLPDERFFSDIYSKKLINLQRLVELKPKWKSSIKIMIEKLWHFKIIDASLRSILYINYNRRGFSKEEPYESFCKVGSPSMLKEIFSSLEKADIQLVEKVIAESGFSAKYFREYFNIDSVYFEKSKIDHQPKIHSLF